MPKYANAQVAHVWANRETNGIRAAESHNGNISFEDATLYSYSTAIALQTDKRAPDGRRVVFLTSHSYSVTTSGHVSDVYRALAYGSPASAWRIFRVPIVVVGTGYGRGTYAATEKEMHAGNLAHFLDSAVEAHARMKRARKEGSRDQAASDAAEALENGREYARIFRMNWREPESLDTLADKLEAARKRAAARAKREQEKRAKRNRERDAGLFAAWLSGEPGAFLPRSYYAAPDGSAYIRRSPDGEHLQTSQGASVPWAHAVKAFRFIKLCRTRGQGWSANGRTIRVGHFVVDSIDAKGNMRAGCHRFAWPEIERLAREQGVFDEAPSDEALEESGRH